MSTLGLKKFIDGCGNIIRVDYDMCDSRIVAQHYFKSSYDNKLGYRDCYHCSDGPATIEYYENGNTKLEKYYIDGKLHRLEGPAIIEYEEDGGIKNKIYAIDNYKCLNVEDFDLRLEAFTAKARSAEQKSIAKLYEKINCLFFWSLLENGLYEEAHLIFSAVLCSLVRKGFCPGHRECIDNHFSIDENALFPSLPQLPLIKLNSESYLERFLKKNALSESELATWFDSHFKYEVMSDNSLKIVSSFTTGTHTFFSKNKVLHKEDGPACIGCVFEGTRSIYYIKGILQREDGPAITSGICGKRDKYYYKGKRVEVSSKEEYLKRVEMMRLSEYF